jgi:peroxiredoxin
MIKILLLTLTSLAIAFPLQAKPLGEGAEIPDVQLLTEQGKPVNLRELARDRPTVLIFYRGGWCPYCTTHLSALAKSEKEILAAGYQILAISPDSPASLKATPDRESLGFTLLSDSQATAAKAFGLAFQMPGDLVSKYKSEYQIDVEKASGENHHLLPHPAVYIVSPKGVITYSYVNEDYKVRLTPEKILKEIQKKP